MSNKFANLRELIPDCFKMNQRLQDWRASETSTPEAYEVFKQYVNDNNELVERVAKAFYEDTKEYNSWECIEQTMLNKSKEEVAEYRLTYPFEFVCEQLDIEPYHGFNHNDTHLGSYKTKNDAEKDVKEYMHQTGNMGVVLATDELSDVQFYQLDGVYQIGEENATA